MKYEQNTKYEYLQEWSDSLNDGQYGLALKVTDSGQSYNDTNGYVEVYFNIETEYNGGSIFLTVYLYTLMSVLFLEGLISFDFRLFLQVVFALQFFH